MQIVESATKNVEAQMVEMMVPLYSYGCAKKIEKSLSHLKGIYSVNIEYKEQKVTVWGICNKYQVLTTLRSKRKAARFWNTQEEEEEEIIQDHEDHNNAALELERSNRPSFNILKLNNKFRSLSLKLACKKVMAATRSYSLPNISNKL